jgi:hypothetical protein
MAKTTKKATIGLIANTPAKKTSTKKSVSKSAGTLTSVTKGGGNTAAAKAGLQKAKSGGAAKAAAKLTKPVKVGSKPAYYFTQDGMRVPSRARKDILESAGVGSAKQVESQIINDLSKTAMRAKIVEMNKKKKKK